MKEFVLITILLNSIAGQYHGDPNDPKVLINMDSIEIVQHVNQARESIAYHLNITNMETVQWDEGLVAKVKTLSTHCNSIRPDGYRFVFCDIDMDGEIRNDPEMFIVLPTEEQLKYLGDDDPKWILDWVEQNKNAPSFLAAEFAYPPQTKIGCARHRCAGSISPKSPKYASHKYSVSYICLLGDVSEVSSDLIKFKGF